MPAWIVSIIKGLFGTVLTFFKDSYDEEKLKKEASEAAAAKKRLQSALEGERLEEELADVSDSVAPIDSDQIDRAISDYNGPTPT